MEEEKLKRRKEKAFIIKNKRQFADACNDLASYYYKNLRYSDALKEYKQQAEICKKLGLQMKWAACQRMIGEMYLLMAQFDKAMKYVWQHWAVAHKLQNITEEVKAKETIGRIYLVQGQSISNKEKSKISLKAAEKAFMESLNLCNMCLNKTSQRGLLNTQARILLNMGDVQEHLGFFDEAIKYIKKAIKICLNEELHEVLHNCYTTEASMHSNKKDYANALSCLNRALEVVCRLKDQDMKTCEALALKADILCKMSDYRGAKEILLKAWKLETPDEYDRKNIELNLKVVVAMCETEDLLKSSDKTDHITLKKLYEKLGDGACRLKIYAAAAEYYHEMLEHAVLAGDCGKTLGPIYVSLYQTYKDMGCYNEALAYCEKEYELIKDEPKEAVTTLYNIAELLFLDNRPYPIVEKACLDARNAAKKWNPKKYETRVLKSLLKYQMKYGETDKMEETKVELHALGYNDFDNLENSEDEQSSEGGDVTDADTTHVGDDVRLEDLPGLSDTNDKEAADKPTETSNIIITRNPKGETLLHRACISGNKHKVESLLAKGHPVNIRDNAGWQPLHEACIYGRLEIADLLISSGADVNDRGGSNCCGTTPLHDAASNGHLDVVQLLLEKGAIPSVKNDLNETPLDALQKWRSNKSKLTKENEKFYTYICNQINHLVENSGVNYDISKSKPTVNPIKDTSLPSTSKSGNNIQDVITIGESNDGNIDSQNRNQSALASNDLNTNEQVTEPVFKINNIKKVIKWGITNDVDVNENISNNFQISKNLGSEVIVDESMLHTSKELSDSLTKNTGSADFDTSEPRISVEPVKDILLTNTSEMSTNNQEIVIVYDSDDEIDESQNNRNQSTPVSNDTNINQVTEPVLKSKDIKKEIEWCISNNDDVNVNVSPEEYESMWNISRDLVISLTKSTVSCNFDTSEQKITRKPLKDELLPGTSKISNNNQEFIIIYDTDDEIVESPNNKNQSALAFTDTNIINQVTEPVLKIKNINKEMECGISSNVDVNENISDNFQENGNVCSTSRELIDCLTKNAANVGTSESKVRVEKAIKHAKLPSTSKVKNNSDDFLIFDDSIDSDEFPVVDVKKSITPVKPIKDIILANFSQLSSNIQASSYLSIPSDNLETLDAQSSNYSTEISCVEEYTSGTSTVNQNAGEIPEEEGNKCIPASLTPSKVVVNDKLDNDLATNINNKKRRPSVSLNAVAKKCSSDDRRNSIKNRQEVTEPVVESKNITKRKNSRISDDVHLNRNSPNSNNVLDNESNMCSKVVTAKCLQNICGVNDSLTESGIDFDISVSTTLKPINNMSQPSTSKMSSNIQTLHNNKHHRGFPSDALETLDSQSSNHTTEISTVKDQTSKISDSTNRNVDESPEEEVNNSILALLTFSEVTNDKLDENLDINNHNNKRKLSDPFTVATKKRLLDNRNSIENTTDPVESKKNMKRKKSQVSENVSSEVIASESNDSLIKDTDGVDLNTSVSRTSVSPIKDISLPISSKISINIQDSQNNNQTSLPPEDIQSSGYHSVYHETEISSDRAYISTKSASINVTVREFPEADVNKSLPALFTPNNVSNHELDNDLATNKQCNNKKKNKRKLSETLTTVANKCSLDNRENNIENINTVTEPLVKSKKSNKRKNSRMSGVIDVNTNDNIQHGENVASAVIASEFMLNTSSNLNDSLSENDVGVDLDTSEPKTSVNAITDIALPSTSEIIDYIQESQNNKNIPSEDTESLHDQSVYGETEISGYNPHRSAISASMYRNTSEFSEDDSNKSIPVLFICKKVGNRLRIKKQNNRKKTDKKVKEKKKKSTKQRITTSKILSQDLLSENYRNTNDGVDLAQSMNPGIQQIANVTQPINIAQPSNCPIQMQTYPSTTVKVIIGDEVLLIPLDSDMLNELTISWLVEEVKSRYYKLKGTTPVFILMTSDDTILSEEEALNLVLSSPELKACFTNCDVSAEEALDLERRYAADIYDDLTRDITDDVLILPHDGSNQSSLPRPDPDKSPLPIPPSPKHETSPQPTRQPPESPLPSALYPKRENSPKPRSPGPQSPLLSSLCPKRENLPLPSSPRPKSPRPGSLANPTSPGCGFSGPSLPSKSMPSPGTPTDPQDPMMSQSVCLEEQELDDEILQLLGDAPIPESRLGPPVHKAVAKRWQKILAQGLQKEVTEQIMEVYSVPANCDLLLAPTLNPEVKATIPENTLNVDSSLMEQQKQLGLAISALGSAVNSILLNETSKQIILKPISDACRLLCDIHFRETENRRHNVITSANPELQDSLVNTVRGNQLFEDNKIKTEKFIQQPGEALNDVPNSAFDN